MQRSGFLVVVAALLVAAAAGVLVWTNFFGTSHPGAAGGPDSSSSEPVAQSAPPTAKELVDLMTSEAAQGAFVATFSDKDVPKWILAPGHKLERFSLNSGDSVFARLTSSVPLDTKSGQWLTLGLSATLPLPYAKLYNGKTLEIGIIARSAQSNGSQSMGVAYATQQSGNSGWKQIELKSDFTLIQFKYEVPKLEPEYTNQPIIVIHSDPVANSGAIELIGVYIKPIN